MTELAILDQVIYQEMMAHPAIFMHAAPRRIAILGDENCGVLREVLQHPSIESIVHIHDTKPRLIHHDERVTLHEGSVGDWLKNTLPESFDLLIIAEIAKPQYFAAFANVLHPEGCIIQEADSPFKLQPLKQMQQALLQNHFQDVRFLMYAQPAFPNGLRTAVLAKKSGNFKRIREKDIFDKPFVTRYYNFDVHRAALVLPEFMRNELESTT